MFKSEHENKKKTIHSMFISFTKWQMPKTMQMQMANARFAK